MNGMNRTVTDSDGNTAAHATSSAAAQLRKRRSPSSTAKRQARGDRHAPIQSESSSTRWLRLHVRGISARITNQRKTLMNPNLCSSTRFGLAVALLCTACFTSNSAAQGAESARQEKLRADLEKRFKAADTNADGRLSRDEAKGGMPRIYRNFDAIDTDKKGSISLEQIAAFAEKQGGRR